MVAILKRMRRLKTLLDVRLGPGAAIISTDVKRIHLNFARKINDGHMGPRKFWRTCLPRLKYHNPAVPMTVDFRGDQEGPASLTVFFNAPTDSPSSNANPAAPTMSTSGDKAPSQHHEHFETTKSINMKHKHESAILEELMKLVEGRPVTASAEEQEELRELEEERKRSEQDRVRQAAVLASRRRQAEILAQARQSVDAQAAA